MALGMKSDEKGREEGHAGRGVSIAGERKAGQHLSGTQLMTVLSECLLRITTPVTLSHIPFPSV